VGINGYSKGIMRNNGKVFFANQKLRDSKVREKNKVGRASWVVHTMGKPLLYGKTCLQQACTPLHIEVQHHSWE